MSTQQFKVTQSLQMINLSIDDLSNLITNCISKQLKTIKEYQKSETSNSENEILTREEVKDLLKISYTTLWKYNKNGTLKAKKLGRKVYYLREDLSNFLNGAV